MSSNVRFNDTTTSTGFLSGFIESTIDMPPDGKNGDCIVHYEGDHSQYELTVPLVNGIREGEAMILHNNMPYLKLHYNNGSLTGAIERMNDRGIRELRGELTNGVESGLFSEYDESGSVVWQGYYRNGQRYSEVRKRPTKSNQEDGSGEFYELDENGLPTQLCLYVNGVRNRVLAQFNATTMTELDRNGKRVYEGEFKGDMEEGFVREGKGTEFARDGRLTTWKNGKRDGVGTESMGYYPVYEGEWKDGKRHGNGKEMDRNGRVVISGRWVNGLYRSDIKTIPSSSMSSPHTVFNRSTGDSSCNDPEMTELKLGSSIPLKRIVIRDYRYRTIRLVELDGLSELESVVVGKNCFSTVRNCSDAVWSKRTDGSCRVVNCPTLRSIVIGDASFCDYHSFELTHLPSLRSIEMSEDCFTSASSFSLTGSTGLMSQRTDLPQLQTVKLGRTAFYCCRSIVFESDWRNGMMTQICQCFSPSNLIRLRFVGMRILDCHFDVIPHPMRTH